jgi:hypothetical protein
MAFSLTDLGTALGGRWRPGIGDPTAVGWLTLAAYFIAAYLAFLAYRACRADRQRPVSALSHEPVNQRLLASFWLLACFTLTALGINKQLDLQTLFTQTMRDVAYVQGWYDERRRVQALFVVTIASAVVMSGGVLAWVLRHVLSKVWMAVLGLCWLTSFVVIRAASFHHVDAWLGAMPRGFNVAFELSGIALIALGAGSALRSDRDRRSGSGPASRPD